ncbi:hypothetical protein Vadar_028866 [Vaccinium darrowii]|uniref:Uncharacterized protein n=1 Tax=Vaccinium darrowii TaxID=229202 RepID=A0ACB7ZNL1_9ERIC|nr:hypothetical protein Vadar_028866 [Vaccinium darrowii]
MDNGQRQGNTTQEYDHLDWHKVNNYPAAASFPVSLSPMPENNNQFVFPSTTTLPLPENRLPTFPHNIQINPYHPLPKTAFPNNNTAYDPTTLEADFSRLNLLSTPSRSPYGGIGSFDRSFLRNLSDSQLDYSNTDFNLQRMRVADAVRGQTGLYMEPHGFPDLGEEGFGLTGLNPSSQLSYGIGGLNRWNRAVNQQNGFYDVGGYGAPSNPNRNGFSSVYDTGYGAPVNLNNRNGFQSAYDTGYGAPSNRNMFQSAYENRTRVDTGYRRRGRSGNGSGADNSGGGARSSSQGNSSSTLSERLNTLPFEQWRGHIVFLAKDQHGYAFLKKKIEEGRKEEVEMIFMEVKDHVRELMVDQYGNYPIQKIFEVCSEEQMTQMLLLVVMDEHYLMSICVDTHGTRAMQKMLEHLSTPDQVSVVMSVLSRNAVTLTKSMSGYRVIERCLKSFTNEQNRHLLHVVAENCADIAMDQAGCCVLQQCVLHSEGEPRQRLITRIISNTLILSENIYGNYVVQYILGMKVPHFTESIMAQLAGSYVTLAMNKYGSNVVERCIRDADEEQATRIIKEIVNSPNFLMVLQDPFGNYVTQTALEIAKGALRHAILGLIQFHYPYLHSHPHGKRVLAKTRGNGKHHRGYDCRR